MEIKVDVGVNTSPAEKALKNLSGSLDNTKNQFKQLDNTISKNDSSYKHLAGTISKTVEASKKLQLAKQSSETGKLKAVTDALTKSFQLLDKQGIQPTVKDLEELEASLNTVVKEMSNLNKFTQETQKSTNNLSQELRELGDAAGDAQTATKTLADGLNDGLLGDVVEGLGKLPSAFKNAYKQIETQSRGLLEKVFGSGSFIASAGGKAAGRIGAFLIVASTLFFAFQDKLKAVFGELFAGIEAVTRNFGTTLIALFTGDFEKIEEIFKRGEDIFNLERAIDTAKAYASILEGSILPALTDITAALNDNRLSLKDQIDLTKDLLTAENAIDEKKKDVLAKETQLAQLLFEEALLSKDKARIAKASADLEQKRLEAIQLNEVIRAREFATAQKIADLEQKRLETSTEIRNKAIERQQIDLKFRQEFNKEIEDLVKNELKVNDLKQQQVKNEIDLINAATNRISPEEKRAQVAAKITELKQLEIDKEKIRFAAIQTNAAILASEFQNEKSRLEFLANKSENDFEERILSIDEIATKQNTLYQIEIDALDRLKFLQGELTQEQKKRYREVTGLQQALDRESQERIKNLAIENINFISSLERAENARTFDERERELKSLFQIAEQNLTRQIELLDQSNTGFVVGLDGKIKEILIGLKGIKKERDIALQDLEKLRVTQIDQAETAFNKLVSDLQAQIQAIEKTKSLRNPLIDEKAIAEDEEKIKELTNQIANAQNDLAINLNGININFANAQRDIFTKAKQSRERLVDGILKLAESSKDVINNILSGISQVSEAQTAFLDRQLDKQKERITEIKDALKEGGTAAQNFTAEQLQLEEDRARELEKRRKEEINKQAGLAQAQIALDAAVSVANVIANATALGAGAFAVPLAIIQSAAVLSAMFAGIAAARAQAATAIGEQGGSIQDIIKRGGELSGSSHKDGGIPFQHKGKAVELEGGEYVFPKGLTKKWKKTFDFIRDNKLTPEQIGLTPNVNLTALVNNSGIEKRLDKSYKLQKQAMKQQKGGFVDINQKRNVKN